ncbi:MAG: 2-C-methyl-D-erythritol 4-phosphate cytidylyltransferase [Ilumatobacteraceae bacterium]|jgi:2-C-methyl-D-erythritol 4-phosphate cytidylyltransferase|nr:2-C-methyl-D-erythritol 4-phosphate cytidylyltransferase [Actinomycetota bacterium]NCV97729.1 2-C-methyl-D-erythritol 4-phosphate cytidylyltransferase [Acidimicrobiia bacterium]NCX17464.1 2-C-methyl-D-erythritol 4-phosphate cytidylyltransferase [Acidimicrobiia bacterium]NCX31231.1 2-C-methyl-D-erythritol 4-phosphate cytidylyltransferase [Actinomycetota bacterium]NCX59609.1 2-C-methyl-D-erythritol 4-phosphate cytidylyltransferase [Actinomycetota bacterium]
MPTGELRRPGEVIWTIVVAAGAGSRFGGPKQFETLGDRRVMDWAVESARESSDGVIVVLPAEVAAREGGIAGGGTRSESVRRGLAAVPKNATIICVHDAARPFANEDDFRRVIEAVAAGADGAVPAIPVADTIKVVDDTGQVTRTPPRGSLRAVQTPQAFRAEMLRRAHAALGEGTDDASLVEAEGGKVVVVDGEVLNRKITTRDDLEWARLQHRGEA